MKKQNNEYRIAILIWIHCCAIISCTKTIKTNGETRITYSTFETVENATLETSNGDLMLKKMVKSDLACRISCNRLEDCQSYNVGPTINNTRECQLLNTTKYANNTNLLENTTNWRHLFIKPDNAPECICKDQTFGRFCQYHQGQLARIYGIADISEGRAVNFRAAKLALDNDATSLDLDEGSCAYSAPYRPTSTDSTRFWRLDMQVQHYIYYVEIYTTILWLTTFTKINNIAINDIRGSFHPQCSKMTGVENPMVGCKNDHMEGRFLTIFRHVPRGCDDYQITNVVICEVLVYGVKIS